MNRRKTLIDKRLRNEPQPNDQHHRKTQCDEHGQLCYIHSVSIGCYIDHVTIIACPYILSTRISTPFIYTLVYRVYDEDMKNELIKKALARPVRQQAVSRVWSTSRDDIGLAVAWAKGKVSLTQVYHAYGIPVGHGSKIYGRLAMALRAHVQTL